MLSYLRCIKSHRGTNDPECRNLSKSYLSCRMDRYVHQASLLSGCALHLPNTYIATRFLLFFVSEQARERQRSSHTTRLSRQNSERVAYTLILHVLVNSMSPLLTTFVLTEISWLLIRSGT
ncbi:hypothetical protein CUC08_Gglean003788 [Alternaria sp. MG1]|nr:hypothetical protein CUC08_Gglean003788 [Alternaria sp. MG1]